MTNFLTPYWEYPATVWCAHCHEPLELTMSSSVDPAATLHGRCWPEWKQNQEGNEMNTTPPTTAREALALAWDLAHPVKARQVLPEGTACLYRLDDDYQIHKTPEGMIARESWTDIRTLDPLPEPEPDWLDAPAVMARGNDWVSCADPQVFVRENKDGTRWVCDTRFYRWDELIDVVPLYPKGQDA